MSQTVAMQVANIIRSQLIRGSGVFVVGSWGAKNMTALEETENRSGALQFRVNGAKFKGYVKIELMWTDTYTVTLFKVVKGAVVIKEVIEDVYCDNLVDIIDSRVET